MQIHKLLFLQFFVLAMLLMPLSSSATDSSCSDELHAQLSSQATRVVLEAIAPLKQEMQLQIERSKAAQTIEELQSQIFEFFTQNERLWIETNERLNSLAEIHLNPGPLEIGNSAQVLPGIYRSEAPTYPQILSALEKKQIDRVISLNIEMGIPFEFDDSPLAPMTKERSERINQAMKNAFMGKPRYQTRRGRFLKAYLRDYEFSLSASSESSAWHQLIGLGGPDRFMAGYFEVLERIKVFRQENLSVLFHCAVGKHRTGLIAMLVKALEAPPLDDQSLEKLYLEFIHFNWYATPISKAHYMLTIPFILRSTPFKKLQSNWITSSKS